MAEILETFSSYRARIEQSLQDIDKPIILSTDIDIPSLKGGDDRSIEMVPIAWPLYERGEPMSYVVTVPPKKTFRFTRTTKTSFGYIVNGSLVLNGSIRIEEGSGS